MRKRLANLGHLAGDFWHSPCAVAPCGATQTGAAEHVGETEVQIIEQEQFGMTNVSPFPTTCDARGIVEMAYLAGLAYKGWFPFGFPTQQTWVGARSPPFHKCPLGSISIFVGG